MTEDEWLQALPDMHGMISYLYNLEPQPSRRKTRLCMAAFCRAIWHLMTDKRCRHAVEVAERFADDPAAEADLKAAIKALPNKRRDYSALHKTAPDDAARSCTSRKEQFLFAALQQVQALTVLAVESGSHDPQTAAAQVRRQTEMIHDIFGNPFRPSPPLPPSVLAWSDRTVPRIAKGIYDERRLPEGTLDAARLAVLADALLDAGCDDEELIAHCRQPGPHVRGCWGVDLILGKS